MPAQPWSERREAYLRERGRLADLIREGYIQNSLGVIEGGARRRVPSGRPSLILIIRPQDNSYASNRPIDPVKLQQEDQQLEARLDSIREQHGRLKQI